MHHGYRYLKILALVHKLTSINEVILNIIILWKQYCGHAHRIFQQVNYHQMRRKDNIFTFSTYKLTTFMDDKKMFPYFSREPISGPQENE